jgi:hypothetical protein
MRESRMAVKFSTMRKLPQAYYSPKNTKEAKT